MIKFENTEVVGWEAAIRGMRNPLNSWDKSDTLFVDNDCDFYDINGNCGPYNGTINPAVERYVFPNVDIGPNDLDLMKRLRNAGTDHRKFMRMLVVYVDITAPLYWWKEFETYKIGTVANSCSTMHTIHKKEFTMDDFSHEHLIESNFFTHYNEDLYIQDSPFETLRKTVAMLNTMRDEYLDYSAGLSQDMDRDTMLRLYAEQKDIWWQMIQLLPTSYNQRRTLMLNYEVLANIYKSRKNHKLDEWSVGFMDWIKCLPYSVLITGVEE